MEYAKFGDTFYIRADKGDELIASVLKVCECENIKSCIFSGIGGCSEALIQTFIPEKGEFETQAISGSLEMISINGNIISDGNRLYHHAHALFSYKKDGGHFTAAGHLKETTVLYTAEIELRPVTGGTIGRTYNPETGTGFWKLK
ncbi:MAG: DUF296 domain-containing protein [Oscillospiraceae bacterium]|nr:DUF296 domain-containing protein [Oscillospiraceae bacterium]